MYLNGSVATTDFFFKKKKKQQQSLSTEQIKIRPIAILEVETRSHIGS